MAKKNEKEKGFTTAQERGRRRINTTVGVIVAAMAVIGIAGMAMKGPDSSAQAAAGSTTAQEQQVAAASSQSTASAQESAAASQTTASTAQTEIIVAQSEEKTTTEETAVTPAGGTESAPAESTMSEAETISGTYTLPADTSVYATASESGQAIAQLYAGNQVVVGESAGNGWYSVTVWVGANGSYTEMTGFMKLQ